MMENFTLKIATPCHEDWGKMTAQEQGRFCSACSKCVVDLTDKQPTEIKQLYDQHGGDMCGRARISQLKPARKSFLSKPYFPVSGLRFIQRFAFAMLLAGAFVLGGADKAQAQDPEPVKMGIVAYVPSNSVEGKVSWDNGEAASGLTVYLRDEDGNEIRTTLTDHRGIYSFSGQWFGKYRIDLGGFQIERGNAKVEFARETHLKRDFVIEEPILMGDTVLEILPHHVPAFDQIIDENEPETSNIHFLQGQNPIEETLQNGTQVRISLESGELIAYPNPSNDKVYLAASNFPDGPLQIQVWDLKGQKVHEESWSPTIVPILILQIANYSSGTYLLQIIQADSDMKTVRIIRQ